jgi:microsomal epoxide hydrolase
VVRTYQNARWFVLQLQEALMHNSLDRRDFLAGAAATTAVAFSQVARAAATPAPFVVDTPEQVLNEIRRRVAAPRWPKTSAGAGWKYGLEAAWFRELVDYWATEFDWRAQERAVNATPQFTAVIGGRTMHFAHMLPDKPRDAGVQMPILILHGWPYTFATMLPLAHRMVATGYEVVVPSLPGSVFSETVEPEIRGLRRIARNISSLMTEVLGHDRYIVHGGDHGSVVADWLALDTSDVAGIHANSVAFRHQGAEFGTGKTGVTDATPEEERFVAEEKAMTERESAYFKLQNTRPETIAYALSDSPVGWAAYMLDKWQKWNDPQEGQFDRVFGRDRLLTELMLFLISDSVATSIWPYAGFALEPFSVPKGRKIDVPYGYSEFPDPLSAPIPRSFAARSRSDIRLWRRHQRGGHFPMLSQLDVLTRDLTDFAASVRTR